MRSPRITLRGAQLGGVPCVRGLRIPVSVVVAMVAEGMSAAENVELYPVLEREDVAEVLRFAASTR